MKKAIFSVFLLVCLISSPYASYAAEREGYAGRGKEYAAASEDVVDLLVEMLVGNGTLTQEQGQKLAQRAKRLEAEMVSAKQKEAEERKRASVEQWREQEIPMQTSWKDGIRFESRNGDFKTKIGGRIFSDLLNTYSHGDLPDSIRPLGDFNNRNDEAYMRSVRLNIEGTMYEDYFYNFEYEFNGDINTKTEVDGLRDMYIGMKNIPFIGSVSVGHMKEPFSLEESTSHSNTIFLERSLANVFAPGFSWGVGIHNAVLDDRVTFAGGIFLNSDNSGTTSYGDAWNLTARVTGLPWYGGKDKLLHIGTSYSLRNPKEGGFVTADHTIRFRQRPDMYTRDYIVDTGTFDINKENRLGLESAFVYGPFSLQGEFIGTWLEPYDTAQDSTGFLYGGYGALSYIITGEHRIYDKNDGRFKGVIPDKNFSLKNFSLKDRSWGAWEITARWSYLSLEDKDMDIQGGKAFATTVGLNWYLNPNMRIMLNWVHSELEDTNGAIDGIQVRVQVTF